MELVRDCEKLAEDQGEWHLYAEDKKTGERVRCRVRKIPSSIERSIERRLSGAKRKVIYGRKGSVVEYDNDRSAAELVAKAVYALTDTENFELRAGDQGAAEFYARVTGAPVEVGQLVKLDGHWSEELRNRICGMSDDFRNWIIAKAKVIQAIEEREAAEEDAGKDES